MPVSSPVLQKPTQKKELGQQEFLQALRVAAPLALEGNDEAIRKFILILKKLMPIDLSSGRYKNLGKLLLRLGTYLPLLSSRYRAGKAHRRKMRHSVQDIVETVNFILKKLMEDPVDTKVVQETMEIFTQNLDRVDKLKAKFEQYDPGEDVKKEIMNTEMIVADQSTSNFGQINLMFKPFNVAVTRTTSLASLLAAIENRNSFSFAIIDYLIGGEELTGLGVLKKIQSMGLDIRLIFFIDINNRGGMEICREENIPYITGRSSENEILTAINKAKGD